MPIFIKLNDNYYNIHYILKVEDAPQGVEVSMCDGEMVRVKGNDFQNASSLVRKIDKLRHKRSSDTQP